MTSTGSTGGSATPGSKSKIAAGLLAIFLGGFGIHKFYLGYRKPAVIMLVGGLIGFFGSFLLLPLLLIIATSIVGFISRSPMPNSSRFTSRARATGSNHVTRGLLVTATAACEVVAYAPGVSDRLFAQGVSCPIKAWFGTQCPFCGMTHGVVAFSGEMCLAPLLRMPLHGYLCSGFWYR